MSKKRKKGWSTYRLIEVGEEKHKELLDRMAMGEPPARLARELRQQGYFKDIKDSSLQKMLYRARKSRVVEPMLEEIKDKVFRGKGSTAGLRKLSVASELEDLAVIQRRRVEASLNTEAKTPGLLLKVTSDEIQNHAKLLMQLQNIYFETGVIARAPKVLQAEVIAPQGFEAGVSWHKEIEARRERTLKVMQGILESEIDDAEFTEIETEDSD